MSLNAMVRIPLSSSRGNEIGFGLRKQPLLFSPKTAPPQRRMLVVKAKGKRGMDNRRFQKPPPSLPKIPDDGNPRFVVFIRMANVYLWYPLSIIEGGTTAKIMVAAKDNFLGKYIYKDTLARNLASVIYKDEKEIIKTAKRQHRALQTTKQFRYGYKLVQNGNLRSALSSSDVMELPTPDKLKTVIDKAIDFFGDAKKSFGKLTSLNSGSSEEAEKASTEKAN